MPSGDWIILLVALPMAGGVLATALRGWQPAQRVVTTIALLTTFALSLRWLAAVHPGKTLVTQAGGWPAPFGISLVFDELSGLLVAVGSLAALAIYLYGFTSADQERGRGWFHPLVNMLMVGVNFAFLTGDLFNLFVAFEVMLLTSYVLLCLGGGRAQLAQAYKYVMLNLIGSVFFVISAGMVYGMTGTLNYADLAVRVAEAGQGGEPLPADFPAVAVLLLFVFGLKAAIFPLWFWLPDTYHTCSISVAALFSALLTKVGVYAMVRLLPMIFAAPVLEEHGPITLILAITSVATMLLAALAALGMNQIRRILAMMLISHVGYMIFGVSVMTESSLAGAVFYMAQHMIVMAALFLCCGLIERRAGTSDLRELGGLASRAPWLAAMFFIAALSLIGLPPMSGFYGKLLLVREGFRLSGEGHWVLSAAGLVAGFLTLLVMAKVWSRTFWGESKNDRRSEMAETGEPFPAPLSLVPPYSALAALTVAVLAFSLAAEPMVRASSAATEQLSAPKRYVEAVLPGGVWPAPTRAARPSQPSFMIDMRGRDARAAQEPSP